MYFSLIVGLRDTPANPTYRRARQPRKPKQAGGRCDLAPACFGLTQFIYCCLPLDIDQISKHLVGYADDLGVGLKTSLGGDQFNKLGTDVDV